MAGALSPVLPRALDLHQLQPRLRVDGVAARRDAGAPEPPVPRACFEAQWSWLTYFHNAIAARAFLAVDCAALAAVDAARRRWVLGWLAENGLPAVETGSYYVKSFRVDGPVPDWLRPLARDGLVRLCFKPPQV